MTKKHDQNDFFCAKNGRFFENLSYKHEVFEFLDSFIETVVLFKPVNNIKS